MLSIPLLLAVMGGAAQAQAIKPANTIMVYSADTITNDSKTVAFNFVFQHCQITGQLIPYESFQKPTEQELSAAERFVAVKTMACDDLTNQIDVIKPYHISIGKLPVDAGQNFSIERPTVSINAALAAYGVNFAKKASEAVHDCEEALGVEECHRALKATDVASKK
jgi:hypothetical protein